MSVPEKKDSVIVVCGTSESPHTHVGVVPVVSAIEPAYVGEEFCERAKPESPDLLSGDY
jgi:hypothetical protein